ncbi:colicin release lysis protein [Klebsiella pneumoniae]|nr:MULTISPECIES: colicin release lysis protein [Klebsiella]ELA2523804.1 colicin release lysis protein [Klebsiella pneumoniae]MCQ8497800.1 colicin release lysis protein [Klebsiella pneumoniae]MDR4658482.1 colicin release lysis protein [Klebsiella pneumoniae]MDR4673853.1 colicin release lysis protein [Klebsiella pneumoniae]HBX5310682.1 lysis protein [Klebsiella pneumoniae]
MNRKKLLFLLVFLVTGELLTACQANYIWGVQRGTVAPSSSSDLTGINVQ